MKRRIANDPYDNATFDYNIGLVVNELERRFILYLIGGEYEKMFYTLTGEEPQDEHGNINQALGRVRLDIEISESQRRGKVKEKSAEPDYKGMLDFILGQRLKNYLESSDDLVDSVPELKDVLPFLGITPASNRITQDVYDAICRIPWLQQQLIDFFNNPKIRATLGKQAAVELPHIFENMSYPQFLWIVPICLAQEIQNRMHPSLLEVYKKVRFYGRVMGGAIGMLVQDYRHLKVAKWKLYSLGSLNCIAVVVLLSIVSDATKEMLSQQRLNLKDRVRHADKFKVLDEFMVNPDDLRDLLQLEDIVKPSILESIQIQGLDASRYISGYRDESHPESQVFQQARAYAFYRFSI